MAKTKKQARKDSSVVATFAFSDIGIRATVSSSEVYVSVDRHSVLGESGKLYLSSLNWGGRGGASPDTARQFVAALTLAATIAEAMDKDAARYVITYASPHGDDNVGPCRKCSGTMRMPTAARAQPQDGALLLTPEEREEAWHKFLHTDIEGQTWHDFLADVVLAKAAAHYEARIAEIERQYREQHQINMRERSRLERERDEAMANLATAIIEVGQSRDAEKVINELVAGLRNERDAAIANYEAHKSEPCTPLWMQAERLKEKDLEIERCINHNFALGQKLDAADALLRRWFALVGSRSHAHPGEVELVDETEAHLTVAPPVATIPMILHCPICRLQHIDTDEWATTRLHRTHLCKPEDGGCGKEFRPANISTIGVKELPTKTPSPVAAKDDSESDHWQQAYLDVLGDSQHLYLAAKEVYDNVYNNIVSADEVFDAHTRLDAKLKAYIEAHPMSSETGKSTVAAKDVDK